MANLQNIKYKRNFLAKVIIKIDFLSLLDESIVFAPNVLNIIQAYFQYNDKDLIKTINNINFKTSSSEILQIIEKRYKNNSGKILCSISKECFFLEFDTYESFTILLDYITKIFSELYKSKNKIQIKRIGLRYINLFDENKIKIQKNYFVKELHDIMDFKNKKINEMDMLISRGFLNLEYFNEDNRTIYKFGKNNSQYPGEIIGKSLLLDIDSIFKGLCDKEEDLIAIIKKNHDIAQGLFEQTITDEFRELLNKDE